jgi:hypothetical protein
VVLHDKLFYCWLDNVMFVNSPLVSAILSSAEPHYMHELLAAENIDTGGVWGVRIFISESSGI